MAPAVFLRDSFASPGGPRERRLLGANACWDSLSLPPPPFHLGPLRTLHILSKPNGMTLVLFKSRNGIHVIKQYEQQVVLFYGTNGCSFYKIVREVIRTVSWYESPFTLF